MRFEGISAFGIGAFIPVVGTYVDYCQRGYKISWADLGGNLDDYLAGGVLLLAGWALARTWPMAALYLTAAWAYMTSLMVSSFWGQVQDTLRGQPDPENGVILCGKFMILSICLASLVLSLRRAGTRLGGG
jgi:hypothetical protein